MNANEIIHDDMTFQGQIRSEMKYVDGELYWKNRKSGRTNIDRPAGCIDATNGYRKVTFNYKQYSAHVLVWIYFFGAIPDGMVIDHINRNRSDNRIENLRVVSASGNARNRDMSSNNLSGFNGVHYRPTRQGKPRWSAQITVEGEIIRLGTYKNKEDAIAARKSADILYGYENGLDK